MVGFDPTLPVSLYIHVPFCRKKCDYCAFYSRRMKDNEIDDYFNLISKELNEIKKEIKVPFYTIFIGGGNPGVLGFERIKELLLSATELGKPEEVTVECNPEDIDIGIMTLEGLVDRISIGIQSMDDKVLKTLGRSLDSSTNYKALKLLSSLPFKWNADIITAVPSERLEDTISDIEIVSSFNPGHISFYCLTFEEGTPLIRREKPISDEAEAEFLEKGWKKLEELGYSHYEVSNFAKPGQECLHNKVYWNLGQYIGLGPSAESALGKSEMVVMRNTESLEEFFSTHAFNCDMLSVEETEESYLLTTLRTKYGINKKEYKERFGKDFDSVYGERIAILDKKDYLETSSSFSITEQGMLTLDSIILSLSLAI